ncbi:PREDICTED: fumarylacetoacetate hydrolase domain-containing protein 2-like [Branchiostoma belcheri]|uniref:Fumarylacetoacetate hydrolase domain-containing protein 2-like n=1 Tax=Branchiostoma belcheri TaxID=7741 RepID=A0A6P5ATI4_BRABE|nr:PREDICTED: fumarylacetoacetate hydrolase domain-containing protein 2-like [Branchiostoma belcheri]
MRLVSFRERGSDGTPRVGVEVAPGGGVLDLSVASPTLPRDMLQFQSPGACSHVGVEVAPGGGVLDLSAASPALPRDMCSFLAAGQSAMDAAKSAMDAGQHVLRRDQITLTSPVPNPGKVICVGMNYKDHCLEQNAPIPKEPIFFSKFGNTITGPEDDIIHPDNSDQVDWEVEMTVVIGKQGKDIKEEDVYDHVAGYTVADDVSARDWQMKRNGGQWLLGKTFDSFCPLGPAIVTKDEIPDPHTLGLRCRVNGNTVQDSSTEQLVFQVPTLVAWISRIVTLCPGDVILTGTPPGVGVFRKPPVFLKRGDVVECEIDGIGTIRNKVV